MALSFQGAARYGLAMGVGERLHAAVLRRVLCVWWGWRVRRWVPPFLGGGGNVLLDPRTPCMLSKCSTSELVDFFLNRGSPSTRLELHPKAALHEAA